MKKTIRLLVGLCLLVLMAFCFLPAGAAEGDVEITFAVGDSTLSINGEDVAVTTPYVIDGTTLVPVRVITEAFGADVVWNGEDQSVTVSYSDVEIKLTIGNKTAYINGNAIELLAAPEVKDSTTMIPLRFITESFGADVTYDAATARITVIKEMTISNSIRDYSLILKRSDKELVGDSFLGWSMIHSPEMKLLYRSFDGTGNVFGNEDETGYIEVSLVTFEDETIEDVYLEYREISQKFSVSKFEKAKTPSGVDYVLVQYSTSDGYYEIRTYVKGKTGFMVSIELDSSADRSRFDDLADITASFDMKYDAALTEDLSDVSKATGNHTYKSDYFALEMDVPGYLYLLESSTKENVVEFYDYDEKNPVSSIGLSLYSAYDGHDAKSWAETDYANNKDLLNPEYATFKAVEECVVGTKRAYVYEYVETHGEEHKVTYDMFVDAGEYFYNISISGKKGRIEDVKDAIFKSIVFKELDTKRVGQVIRTDNYGEVVYKDYEIKSAGIKFKAPATWEKISEDSSGMLFADASGVRNVAIVTTSKTAVDNLSHSLFTQYMYDEAKANKLVTMQESAPKKITIGTKTGYYFTYVTDLDGERYLIGIYVFSSNDKYIMIQYGTPEYINGVKTQSIFNSIIQSVKY